MLFQDALAQPPAQSLVPPSEVAGCAGGRRARPLLWPVTGLALAVLAAVEGGLNEALGEAAVVTAVPGVLAAAALVGAGRWPLVAGALATATLAGSALLGLPGAGGAQLVSVLLAVGAAAAGAAHWRRDAALLALVLLVGSAAFAVVGGSRTGLWESFFTCAAAAVAWSVGRLVRRERVTAERLRRTAAELEASRAAAAQAAVVAERARMAREVHDSVAHSVSVMVLQMGGLRRLLPHEPRAQEVLAGLEQLGREAVDEMRRVVGVLREAAPAPGAAGPPPAPVSALERLEGVVAAVRAGGVAVRLSSGGRPRAVGEEVATTAVRVVQEALSNAVRHAPGAPVAVSVRWEEELVVAVEDAGAGHRVADTPATTAPGTGGHGLRHMRERVGAVGGSLEVGPVPSGGWRVRAALPAGAPAEAGAA